MLLSPFFDVLLHIGQKLENEQIAGDYYLYIFIDFCNILLIYL